MTEFNSGLRVCCNPLYIDCFCDAYYLPFSENSFKIAILCNPYGYGFDDNEEADCLLRELTRVLVDDSQIIIVGSHKNPYCIPEIVKRRVDEFSVEGINISYTMKDFDSTSPYWEHHFWTVGRTFRAEPTKEMTLYVKK